MIIPETGDVCSDRSLGLSRLRRSDRENVEFSESSFDFLEILDALFRTHVVPSIEIGRIHLPSTRLLVRLRKNPQRTRERESRRINSSDKSTRSIRGDRRGFEEI